MEATPESTVEVPKIEDNYEEILKLLRREWKWAAASDFLYKFNPMLHLDFLDLADVEHDIIRGSSETIMTVFVKILHVLTSIRGLAPDTWETYLRRLYARRVPENRVWGSEEEPITWSELSYMDRLDVLHDLCEWQFQNPLRVRQTMKDDSDDASWRSVPIGRDSKRNEYWRLGRDRLWIQRSVVKPDPPKDLKRKRHPTKGTQQPAKRKASQKGAGKTVAPKGKHKTREPQQKHTKPREKSQKNTNGARLGSRVSRRGGGDGWQKVPDEWLKEPDVQEKGKAPIDQKDVEALFDDDSDLTDLSEQDKPEDTKTKGRTHAASDSGSDLTDIDEDEDAEDEAERRDSTEQSDDFKMDVDPRDDVNFVEFETTCVAITEWREFAEQFKSVKSHNERRLYRYITLVVLPELEEHQLAIEEKQKKELKEMLRREQAAAAAAAAESRPKRSTRLAAIADGEEERKNESTDGDSDVRWGARSTRTRRAAVRGTRWMEEQEEQLAALEASEADDGDEQGQVERVDRQASGRNKSDQDEYRDEDSEDAQPPSTPNTLEINTRGRPRRAAAVKADLLRPVKPTRRRRVRSDSEDAGESDEPFFLNCEICKKSGWNEDDGQHLISCKGCNIWQHMICHDRADKLEGRPKRNWSEEQFLCSSCTVKALNKRPRRGRKPKDVVATDPEDTVNGPEIPTGADAIMDISQPAEANLAHDPAKPSIEHAKVEQLEPPFSDPEPGRIPEHAAASHPHAPNGVHSPEQYLETLAQAQRFFAASTLDSPPRQAEQNAAPNPLLPAQYSTEPALAGQAVASHCLGSPLPESAQYAQNPQFNGYPQVYPNQWTPATNTVPHNEAMMNGKAYIPPSQVTPHESAHSILNGNGQVSHPPSNPQLGYPQATVQP